MFVTRDIESPTVIWGGKVDLASVANTNHSNITLHSHEIHCSYLIITHANTTRLLE